uniref:ABC transporter permease n=1 Tax=Stappia sp. TaxID=1870903 RepID=UPI003BA97BF5
MTTAVRSRENPIVVKARVVGALALREARVTFGAVKLGYFWAIFEPVLGTALLTFIFSIITRHPPIGTSFALFFATGVLTISLYQKLSNSLMAVFEANRGLLAYPLVKETDVVFARFLVILMTYLFIYIIFFGGLITLGLAHFPHRLDLVLLAIGAIAALGFGVGLTNAVIYMLWPTWRRIEAVITRPLFFVSGVFFIPASFPPDIRYWLSWNPIFQAIDFFRVGYYNNYKSQTLDVNYLFLYCSFIVFISLGLERLFRKHQK